MSDNASRHFARTSTTEDSLIGRLWRGEIPLVQTFWLYSVVGGLIIHLLTLALGYIVGLGFGRWDILAVVFAWTAWEFAYSVFMSVAVWQSAGAYAAQKPDYRVNATLAKITVVLGGIILVASLAQMLFPGEFLRSFKPASIDGRLQFEAAIAQLNANLPKKIDAMTTMNKITVKDNVVLFDFKLSTIVNDRNSFVPRIKEKLKSECNNQEISSMLKNGYIIKYVYSDTISQNLAILQLSKSDCANL